LLLPFGWLALSVRWCAPFAPWRLPSLQCYYESLCPCLLLRYCHPYGAATSDFPFASMNRFSRSIHTPKSNSCCLYTGRHSSSDSGYSWTYFPTTDVLVGFDVTYVIDASSAVHLRSSLWLTLDSLNLPFPWRSRPWLLITAAQGSLQSIPAYLLRGADPHRLHSIVKPPWSGLTFVTHTSSSP